MNIISQKSTQPYKANPLPNFRPDCSCIVTCKATDHRDGDGPHLHLHLHGGLSVVSLANIRGSSNALNYINGNFGI